MSAAPFDFSGKRALVTGGSKGIGRVIVSDLQRCGAEVWTVGRSQDLLNQLEKELPNVHGVCVDITNWEETKRVIGDIGPIDLLVNNAGVSHCDSFLDVKPEDFDRTYACNVKALICVSQVVVKGMIERGSGGAIVNVSSAAAMRGLDLHTVYAGTKGAVDATTRVMALELGPHKIRVNCVNPTLVWTEMGKKYWSDPAKSGPLLARIPLGRFAECSDVSNAVLYLLSDQSAMVNGHSLPIEGGLLAQ